MWKTIEGQGKKQVEALQALKSEKEEQQMRWELIKWNRWN